VFWHGLLAEEMGDDEVFFMVVAGIIAFIGVILWYSRLMRASVFKRRPPFLTLLFVTPGICFAILYFILITWADPGEVVPDWRYILLFLLGGGMWLTIFNAAMPLLGPSVKLDVQMQHNPAASLVAAGGMLGVMLAYAFSNIGDGPTIWTTLIPAFLATLTLMLLWFMLETISRVADAVTIDRDVASGLRLGAFLIATGLILGRAMAGDFVSYAGTVEDFVKQGWPAVLLCVLAAVMQRMFQPSPRMPKPPVVSYGLVPALVYLAFAAGWVLYLGKW
jgi:uncharacterized membrane protein YjfL (UPF0719 family)